MILATLEEGLRHHQAGRLDQAEELYRRVLAADPRQPDALHLLGMAAFGRGFPQDGRDLILRAIEAKPHEAIFHANLGLVLEALHRWPEAEAAYRRSLGLNPNNPAALNNLGNLYHVAWRLDEAACCYKAALALDPHFAAAQNNLGNTLAEWNDHDQAIACYRRALAVDPDSFRAEEPRQFLGRAGTLRGGGRRVAPGAKPASSGRGVENPLGPVVAGDRRVVHVDRRASPQAVGGSRRAAADRHGDRRPDRPDAGPGLLAGLSRSP